MRAGDGANSTRERDVLFERHVCCLCALLRLRRRRGLTSYGKRYVTRRLLRDGAVMFDIDAAC